MEIVPTILTDDKKDLEKKLEFLAGKTDRVSIDIIDGKFVSKKTFPLDWLDGHLRKNIVLEYHLMVNNPFSWVQDCDSHEGQRVIGQIESMGDQLDFIDRVESEGMEPGLAIDLYSSVEELNHEAVFRSSIVLAMSIEAGWKEQEFRDESLVKIDQLARLKESLGANFQIGIDGGVNVENIETLKKIGVDVAHCGHAIWGSPDWGGALSQLQLLAR